MSAARVGIIFAFKGFKVFWPALINSDEHREHLPNVE
jgi:hypothetical protein